MTLHVTCPGERPCELEKNVCVPLFGEVCFPHPLGLGSFLFFKLHVWYMHEDI